MLRGMNRRDLLLGGLAAGASLALPARAQDDQALLKQAFDAMGGEGALGAAPVAPVEPAGPPSAAYIARVMEIARREVSRAGASIWRRDVVGVADFAQPSSRPRLHFVNLENGSVRSFLVAHGRGSDREHDGWLKHFSNVPGSEATSRGAYLTCEWYTGKYGTSIRLQGLDPDNHTARERAIVMHPAWYAAPDMIAKYGKLGRSEGCFAMAPSDFNEALWHLSGGRLLFADRIGEA